MSLTLNIISPHRDDAALSLTSTLHGFANLSINIKIISCFTITNWAPFVKKASTVDEISSLRRQEDLAFVKWLGKTASLYDLDMLDSPLREDCIPAPQYGYDIWGILVHGQPKLKEIEKLMKIPVLIKNHDHDIWVYGLGKGGVAALTPLEKSRYEDLSFSESLKKFNPDNISEDIYQDFIIKEAHIPRSAKPSHVILTNTVENYITILKNKISDLNDKNVAWAIPLALGHRDHFIARTAALNAIKEAPFMFYEEIPYALYLSDDEINKHICELEKIISKSLKSSHMTTPGEKYLWHQAMSCYPSQFLDEQILSIIDKLYARNGERIWLTPAFEIWQSNALA
jgi:LmbE family N-acetylglucosaminyl deacetylase